MLRPPCRLKSKALPLCFFSFFGFQVSCKGNQSLWDGFVWWYPHTGRHRIIQHHHKTCHIWPCLEHFQDLRWLPPWCRKLGCTLDRSICLFSPKLSYSFQTTQNLMQRCKLGVTIWYNDYENQNLNCIIIIL